MSGETQFTKGPWSAYRGEDTNFWWIIRDAEGHELGSGDGGFEKDEAHLIAAAPELYEVAEALFKAIDNYLITNTGDEDSVGVLLDCASAALSKARGES